MLFSKACFILNLIGGKTVIISNLSSILGQKKIKISQVIKDTKISRPTLTALYYDTSKGINFHTLNILCEYLKVSVDELLLFYPIDIDTINIKFDGTLVDDGDTYCCDFDGIIKFIQTTPQSLKISGELCGRKTKDSDIPNDFEGYLSLNLHTSILKDTQLLREKIEEAAIDAITTKAMEQLSFESVIFNDISIYYDESTKK